MRRMALVATLAALAGGAGAAQKLGVNVHQSSTVGLDAARDAGLGWVRIDFNWYDAQPTAGAPDFSRFDTLVAAARARNLQVLAVIGYTPAWASAGDRMGGGALNDVPNANTFGPFVTAAVNHFKSSVTYWEIWNEPNLTQFFEGTTQEYLDRVLVPGADAVHAACPACKVLGPALASIGSAYDTWLDTVLAQAAAKLDIVSGHIYAAFTVDDAQAGLTKDSFFNKLEARRVIAPIFTGPRSYREVMLARGVSKPFWLTETGQTANSGNAGEEAAQLLYYRRVLEAMLSRPWWDATLFYEAFDTTGSGYVWGMVLDDPAAAGGYRPKQVMSLLVKATRSPAFGGTGSECSDGLDDDGDNQIDFPSDTTCTSATAPSESAQPAVDGGVPGDGGASDAAASSDGGAAQPDAAISPDGGAAHDAGVGHSGGGGCTAGGSPAPLAAVFVVLGLLGLARRRTRVVVAVALGLLASVVAAAPAKPKRPGLHQVASVEAWDALPMGSRAITIDADFKGATARDRKTGKVLWRGAVQKTADGRQMLRDLGGQLVWLAGRLLYRLDPASGKLLGAPATVPADGECWMDQEHGACYVRCPCELQLLDCASGSPVGPSFRKSFSEFRDPDGEASGGCYGEGGEVLGRAKNLDFVRVEDKNAKGSRMFSPPVAVAIDVTTGKEAWRSSDLALGYWTPTASGISPDQATCFVGDFQGRFAAFVCATGKLLWRGVTPKVAVGLPVHMASWVASPPGIFRRAEATATLHQPTTGKPLWRVPATGPLLIRGDAFDSSLLGWDDHPRNAQFVTPADGKTTLTVTIPPKTSLQSEPGGGFYLIGPDAISALEPNGSVRATVSLTGPQNPIVGPDWLGLFDNTRLVILDRGALTVLADRAGQLNVVSRGPLADGLLLYQWGPSGQAGRAILLVP